MTSPESGEARRRRPALPAFLGDAAYPVLTVVVVLVLWEVTVRALKIPLFLLPPPSTVLDMMVEQPKLIWTHTFTTAYETLLAFALSVLVGVPLGIAIVGWRPFERSIYPLLVASQAIPKVAIAPLLTIWFGFGLAPKVYVAFLIAFFPVVISTVVGLRSVSADMIHLGRSMGLGPVEMFRKVKLPHALPSMFGGFQVAIALSLVGAIVGEFTGADSGLGYLLLLSIGQLDIVRMFAAVIAAVMLGIVLFAVVIVIEGRVIRWHVSRRREPMGTA